MKARLPVTVKEVITLTWHSMIESNEVYELCKYTKNPKENKNSKIMTQ